MSIVGIHQQPIPPRPIGQHQQPPVVQIQSAEMPPLLDLLEAAYLNECLMSGVDSTPTIQAAQPLLAFYKRYLEVYRPVQAFPVDSNYGIMLSNNQRCVISPNLDELPGSMENSGAIQVTTGKSNPGQEGVTEYKSLPTTR